MRPPFNVNSRGGATWDPERRRQEVGPGLVPNSGRSGGLSLGMQTDLAGANSGQVGGRQMRDGPPMPGGGDMIMVRGQESAVGQSSTMWAGRPGFNNNSRPPNAPSSGLRLPTGPPPVLAGAFPHIAVYGFFKSERIVAYLCGNQSGGRCGKAWLG